MRQYTHLPLKKVNYLQKDAMVLPLFPTFPRNSKTTTFKLSKATAQCAGGTESESIVLKKKDHHHNTLVVFQITMIVTGWTPWQGRSNSINHINLQIVK